MADTRVTVQPRMVIMMVSSALILIPQGGDQVIPQVLAVFSF